MEPAHTIARIGFKRWYERQLIEAHAWLVTALLCGIAVAVVLEGLNFRQSFWHELPALAFLFVGGLVCWHALRRFGDLLKEANRLAEHSTCGACGKYAAFHVVAEYARAMQVRCRKCGNEWKMD